MTHRNVYSGMTHRNVYIGITHGKIYMFTLVRVQEQFDSLRVEN